MTLEEYIDDEDEAVNLPFSTSASAAITVSRVVKAEVRKLLSDYTKRVVKQAKLEQMRADSEIAYNYCIHSDFFAYSCENHCSDIISNAIEDAWCAAHPEAKDHQEEKSE